MFDRREHWETVYRTKGTTDVSWFEAEPEVSRKLIRSVASGGSGVIDVGGGASQLVDRLLADGYSPVAVLDVSATALEHARRRLGEVGRQVQWIVGDVTQVGDVGRFDVWHDRAVFHFLTDPEDRRKYVALAKRTIPVGGHLVIGTFAPDGPEKCSGLEVCRYDAAGLSAEFGSDFQLVQEMEHIHHTPAGKLQKFAFAVLRKNR
ncbi:MAG: SAM-dependent methyltransferase [Pirellula sp.]|nr:SAM-dependent methyltransferase [Pirellula sp.]